MAKTVVILGGAFAGLHVAHALLKKRDAGLKVILVSKNSHFYWNIASVRAIVPGIYKDEEIFKPISEALSRYPETSYELVVGTAEAADFEAKTVSVTTASSSEPRSISYDQLLLATGSRTAVTGVPWKAAGSYEEAVALLHATAEKAEAASHIVVAGAGSTGVEVAGELGFAWGKTKEIVLLCAEDKLLGGDIVSSAAANELKKLNVRVEYGTRVEDTKPSESDAKKTDITVSSTEAKTITTDLYLPTFGLVPNSEFIDAKYLEDGARKGLVAVDEFLRVKDTTNVWAAGDLVSNPRAGFMITQKQAAAVAKNIELALAGKPPLAAKGMPVDILAVSTGRSRGAGRMGSFRMPSFGVWLAKGRQLGLNMFPSYLDGSVA
ncbi:hypothetical protein B0T26DRAFT_757819 [Lasiosphaeria miniovina]|uniref:FAD/NAD(P)-binding domain-containing protein n=1 Tax=Lasiosphaeria miniovina TaxID=1954250 RepID=A0AA40DG56_9PEZI|nr:uncharacterized protein B0T26DRAFT_757819 [Lasiosphaeria miniovina]KAK0701840.1 hypothetical protein B0T26DRAFT_757819 [Lasiosphaeria miniovina]